MLKNKTMEKYTKEMDDIEKKTDGSEDIGAKPEGEAVSDAHKDNLTDEEQIADSKVSKKKRGLLLAGAGILAGILLGGYFYGVNYYRGHFLPNTTINGRTCDNLTAGEIARQLQVQYTEEYSLGLTGKNGEEILSITASEVEMTFSVEAEVEKALEKQNAYGWPGAVLFKHISAYEADFGVDYSSERLRKILEEADIFNKGEEPQDAYISEYLAEKKCYEIIPQKEGSRLDKELTIAQAEEALAKMETALDLTACYEQPEITADDVRLQEKLNKLNTLVGTCITYDWNGREEILDAERIHTWLILDEDDVRLDEELVAAYVEEQAKKYDTYGKRRNFVTTLGIEVSLPSGAYGWKTDREAETEALLQLIGEGANTEREPEYSSRGWVKGEYDIGKSYVEIDLTYQHLYLYQDGQIILETDFVSGDMAKGNVTPQGVFGITYKTTDAVLRGADYETPVFYWMPFNGNVGMHDATWRNSFGGDIYLTDGSHGCVNLPLDMAAAIYSYMTAGFPVICYYY